MIDKQGYEKEFIIFENLSKAAYFDSSEEVTFGCQ